MTTTMLDPTRMHPDTLRAVAETVRLSHDIELPEMGNWNGGPCLRHRSEDATAPVPGCRFCGVIPRRHQRVGITWLFFCLRAGLFDSTGLGKTVQIAGLLALLQRNGELWSGLPGPEPPARLGRRALIVCRAATLAQWRAELARMVPSLQTTAVVGDRAERARRLGLGWEVALVGPEMLVNKTARGADQLAQFDIGTVICDDIEMLKNVNKTSKVIRELAEQADRVVIATATPLDKRLTQLYDLGSVLGWRSSFGSREEFQHRYVNMEQVYYTPRLKPTRCKFCRAFLKANHKDKMWVDSNGRQGPCPAKGGLPAHFPLARTTPGAKFTWVEKGAVPERLAEFRAYMAPLALRRTAADADDLHMPTVVPSQVWMELLPEQQARYDEIRKGVLTRLDQEGKKVSRTEAENLWLRAWQVTSSLANLDETRRGASAKLDWVVDALSGDLSEEPVVVYAYFRPTVADLCARLAREKISCARIWGEQHAAEQASAIEAFNSGAARVMVISDAGGMGLNLQKSRRLVMVDTPRSAGRVVQILGRIKRDGSAHETAYLTQLFTDCPIERALAEMVGSEAVMQAAVLDGGNLSPEFQAYEPDRLLQAITG